MVTTKERIKSGGAAIVNLRQTYQTLKAQFTETKATLERRRDELKVWDKLNSSYLTIAECLPLV